MIGIFNESTVNVFKNIKNVFRQIATWTLIAGVVLGCVLICLGNSDSSDIVGKIMGMFFVLGLAMLICTNNIRRLENERPSVQIFALISLFANAIWFVLWTICIWTNTMSVSDAITLYSFATTASIISGFALIASNTMAIYEGAKKGTILPLKITSVIALGICSLHGIVVAFTIEDRFVKAFGNYADSAYARFDRLAGFLGVCWFILLIVALVTSSGESSKVRAEKRKEEQREKKLKREQQQQAYYEQQRAFYEQQAAYQKQQEDATKKQNEPKSDDELRAEIEEKVRREMIEKEVREKLEKEAKAKNAK